MAALLRPPAIGWSGWGRRFRILAAAVLASAAVVLLALAAPSPLAAWFVSPSATLNSYKFSAALSSDEPNLSLDRSLLPSPPPLNSVVSDRIASPSPFLCPSPSPAGDFDAIRAKSSGDDLKVPPLEPDEDFSTTVTSLPPLLAPSPPPAGNFDAKGVNWSSYDPKVPPLEPDEDFSTAVVSLPPFLAPAPSPTGDSDDSVVKSGSIGEESLLHPISPSSTQFPLPVETVSPQTLNLSTVATPPPPFVVDPPSVTGNTDANWVKSGGGHLKVPPSNSEMRLMSAMDRELMFARREIDHSPVISDDTDLYAPLFRNVSVFKRSYELMERILKIYIYQDGPRPIFHTPLLRGIYASEGWFMKLMEENKRFVVKDPNKAHLFYLPYSARQLEEALYKPDSHNLKPLLVFLKNYVDMISAKYPFWNRTSGADHFLVACHDWGPYTTKLHDELCKNTIKALCNADVSEGIFIRGKDVSLPETTIRNPKKPLRDLGGKPVSQRSILAFFAGNMHGRVRPILLDYWSGKDEDMKIYGPLPPRISRKMSYVQHMKSSKFCICPMGYEVNSPRIVEAIYYECVPVIIADNFVPPFDEVLDWSAFSVIVAEKDIPKLKDILLGISLRKYVKMQGNVKRLQKHFLWHPRPVKYDIFHMILHSLWFNRLNQIEVLQ